MATTATTSLIGNKKAAPKAPAKAAAVGPLRWFRVKEDRLVPRRGSGSFLLKRGKEINSGSFDLKALDAAGVEFVEIATPAWYVEQQVVAREKHQEMLDAGHDVGPVPPPYEAPVFAKGSSPSASAEAAS